MLQTGREKKQLAKFMFSRINVALKVSLAEPTTHLVKFHFNLFALFLGNSTRFASCTKFLRFIKELYLL